jgi:esterase/lipase
VSPALPAVLLVHGLGGTAQSMAPLEQALTAHLLPAPVLTVASITLPGHGTTPADLDGITWGEWCAAVEQAVVDADHGGGVVVVGQSMGGALALHAAAGGRAHDAVRAVVTVNTPVADPDAVDGIEWRMARGHTHLEATVVDGEHGYHALPMTAVLAMASGLLDIDLAAITVPVAVVNGALDDSVDPASGDALLAALSGVPLHRLQRHTLARTGHVATFGPEVGALADLVIGIVNGLNGPIVDGGPLA